MNISRAEFLQLGMELLEDIDDTRALSYAEALALILDEEETVDSILRC